MLAAQEAGYPLLDPLDDPDEPVGVAPFPANMVDGVRWRRVRLSRCCAPTRESGRGRRSAGRQGHDRARESHRRRPGGGRRVEAQLVVLAAGAYLTPSILVRSGIGPEPDLRRLAVAAVSVLPVGERLLDHHGTGMGWQLRSAFAPKPPRTTARAAVSASRHREDGEQLLYCGEAGILHLVAWTNPAETPDGYEVSAGVFHLKPRSAGRLRCHSTDPDALPRVTRGFLCGRERPVRCIVEGLEVARALASTGRLRIS